ncbi:MAG TPA: YncE family protein [Polyangia bacterium]|nr:YncE family protein [Polyangia bacterium]
MKQLGNERTARLVLAVALAGGLGVANSARAESTPKGALLALSKRDHTLAIVDPKTLKVVAKAPVGDDPHEVIASADGATAYVSNYGGGAFHSLAVIDLVRQKALSSIDLGALRGPHGLTFAGGKVWFTAEAAKAVGRFDPSRKVVDFILGTGQDRTHMIAVASDLKRIVTTNVSSATVSILDKLPPRAFGGPPGAGGPNGPHGGPNGPPPPNGAKGPPPGAFNGPHGSPEGDWSQTVVPVGRGSEGFDIAGSELWVANAQDGTLSIVDLTTKKVVATVAANVPGANRLKFTPDGKFVVVSSLGRAGVAVFDAKTRTEVKRFDTLVGCAGIQMQPDGARVFVACSRGNYIAVIDAKTWTIAGKIDVGGEPDGLAWAARP